MGVVHSVEEGEVLLAVGIVKMDKFHGPAFVSEGSRRGENVKKIGQRPGF